MSSDLPHRDLSPDPVAELMDTVLSTPSAERAGVLRDLVRRHREHGSELQSRLEALDTLGLLEDDAEGEDGKAIELEPTLPSEIAEFELLEQIGAGGMGVVYRARQPRLDRDVALKLVRPEYALFDGQRERFRREAVAIARLDHPNIVPVFSIGETGSLPYLAMQLVDGIGLADVVRHLADLDPTHLGGRALLDAMQAKMGPISQELLSANLGSLENGWSATVAALVRSVVAALGHAHSRGIVHRDVKPSNVMIARSGRPMLLDFGLSRSADSVDSITRSGAVIGSMPYLSPEQVDGCEVDERGDIFAVGILLYELLTLRSPFASDSTQTTMRNIVSKEPTALRRINRSVPADLAAIVGKCLEKEPERRYPGTDELGADLEAFLQHRPVSASVPTVVGRTARFARREPAKFWLLAAVVVASLTAIGLGGYLADRSDTLAAGERVLAANAVERAVSDGYLALMRGDRRAATAAFGTALRIDGADASALAGKALAAGEDPSIDDPESPTGLFVSAMARVFRGGRGSTDGANEATEMLQQALLRSRTARPIHYGGLARAAAVAGQADLARQTATAMTELWPDSAPVAYWAGFALLEVDPARAAAHLKRAIELEPENVSQSAAAHADLGVAGLQLGDVEAAIASLRQATALDPDNSIALMNLGLALDRTGDEAVALDALRRASEIPGALPGTFYNLGQVLARTDLAGAEAAFERAVEMAPDFAEAWHNLGTLRYRVGDSPQAIEAFERARKLAPDWSEPVRALGAACATAGDAEGAASAFARVVALEPKDEGAHRYLCQLLEYLGRTEDLAQERQRFAQLRKTSASRSPR